MFVRVMAALLLAILSVGVQAKIGTIDKAPASTVLIPHFEVNAANPNGLNTIITLQNTSASATMVNVQLWTDYGVETLHFNVYLTGYDQETLNLYEIFQRALPTTASDGQDPADTISPQGPVSQDINFASCNSYLPSPQDSSVSYELIAAHTGGPSIDYFGGLCGGRDHGDGIARGYITMDVTNQCYAGKVSSPGYFVIGGNGVAGNRNIIVADYLIVDRANQRFFSDSGVHIEASSTDPLTDGAGDYTFYSRMPSVNGQGSDHREALPTAWAGRTSATRTDVEYWRDPFTVIAPFACGTAPAPYNLTQRQVSLFDANGTLVGSPGGSLFPLASGATTGAAIGINQPLGWMFVNLNTAPATVRQSWLSLRQVPSAVSPGAGLGYLVPGIQLGNISATADPTIP